MTTELTPRFEVDRNGYTLKDAPPGFYGYCIGGDDRPWVWSIEGRPLTPNHPRFRRHGNTATLEEAQAALLEALEARRTAVTAFAAHPKPQYHETWEAGYDYDEVVICPYCGHTVDPETQPDDIHDILRETDGRDGDESEVTCDGCEREFKLTLSVSYNFRTDPIEKDPE